MTYSFKTNVLAGAVAIAMAGTGASALDVSFTELSTADLDALTPMMNPLADSTTGTVLENVVGTTPTRRSPWQTSTLYKNTGYYTSVQGGASATYNLAQTSNVLKLIWGSPDDYNDLTITLSGSGESETINGSEVQGPVARSAVAVTISGFSFNTVTFESSKNAFEFANLQTTPVPLPAAGFMLLAGLGGLAMVARRRREEA